MAANDKIKRGRQYDGTLHPPLPEQLPAPPPAPDRVTGTRIVMDKTSPGTRARAAWEVTAGIIPGTPMPEYTRRWCLTSETWEAENAMSDADWQARSDARSTFLIYRDEAFAYANNLHDPRFLNWVRVEWIWF